MIPLAYLPPPVELLEVDLAYTPHPIAGYGGFRVIRVLIRHRGRPLGWITIEEPPDPIPPERITREASWQLGWLLDEAALLDSLTAPRDRADLPAISVVVCTRDRAASLQRCLESLGDLDYPSYEVIVVDNASVTAETAEVTARFPFRCVREERPGLDWARNRGIAEARHEIVAFTDDDVQVDRLWLRGIAEGFEEPDVMLVTGLTAPAELVTEAQVSFEFRYGGMSKGFRSNRWDPAELRPEQIIGAHHLAPLSESSDHDAAGDSNDGEACHRFAASLRSLADGSHRS